MDTKIAAALGLYGGSTMEGRTYHPFSNRTSIICTIKELTVERCGGSLIPLVEAGMNIARFNLAKIKEDDQETWDWLKKQVRELREYEKESGVPIGVIMDLGGPKLRIGDVRPEFRDETGTRIPLARGHKITLTLRDVMGDKECLSIVGDIKRMPRIRTDTPQFILLGDDAYPLRILRREDEYTLVCEAASEIEVHATDGVTFFDIDLGESKDDIGLEDFPFKDLHDLEKALDLSTDMIGVSFASPALMHRVANAVKDHALRMEREKLGADVPETYLVAKIETPSASMDRNIRGILEVPETAAVMVARGDLAVAVTTLAVPAVQARIINLATLYGKPAIVATGLLGSAVDKDEPDIDRSAASDIFNALVSGADALMLGTETSRGKEPVGTTQMLRNMIIEAEARIYSHESSASMSAASCCPLLRQEKLEPQRGYNVEEDFTDVRVDYGICQPAIDIASRLGAGIIASTATTGRNVRNLSRTKPSQLILAITTNRKVARRLLLCRGVFPVVAEYNGPLRDVPNLHEPVEFVRAVRLAVEKLKASKKEIIDTLRDNFREHGQNVTDSLLSANLAAIGFDPDLEDLDTTVIGVMRADFTEVGMETQTIPNTIHILTLPS